MVPLSFFRLVSQISTTVLLRLHSQIDLPTARHLIILGFLEDKAQRATLKTFKHLEGQYGLSYWAYLTALFSSECPAFFFN